MDDASAAPPREVDPEALTARVAGFVAHLRLNDFAVGPAETATALELLAGIDGCDPREVRLGFKSLLAGRKEEWERFDDLFEAYWHGRGRLRRPSATSSRDPRSPSRPGLWLRHLPPPPAGIGERAELPGAGGEGGVGGGDEGDDEAGGRGRLVPSRRSSLARKDLRHVADPAELAEAERIAGDLARAMRHRVSRRYRNAPRAPRLDLRRTVRRNLGRGGEPIDLVRRRRRDRPVRIVVLLDVSGSMEQYSRFFLQFVKGTSSDPGSSPTPMSSTPGSSGSPGRCATATPVRAMSRLSLLAQGFGGGTRIAESLGVFNDRYARTGSQPPLGGDDPLRRLRHRGRLGPVHVARDAAPCAAGRGESSG